jgi:hypothetical protein
MPEDGRGVEDRMTKASTPRSDRSADSAGRRCPTVRRRSAPQGMRRRGQLGEGIAS